MNIVPSVYRPFKIGCRTHILKPSNNHLFHILLTIVTCTRLKTELSSILKWAYYPAIQERASSKMDAFIAIKL